MIPKHNKTFSIQRKSVWSLPDRHLQLQGRMFLPLLKTFLLLQVQFMPKIKASAVFTS